LLLSLDVLVQVPLHRVWPDGHWHVPDWHVSPPVHVLPHVPQFVALGCELLITLTHELPHSVRPEDWHVHLLLLHRVPDGQTVPQTAQLLLSLVVSVQTPLQRVCPAGHLHAPP
jgi:hypothetical protein